MEYIDLRKKMVTVLFYLLTLNINCFSQTIDLSNEFKKINEYNMHIATANDYHYQAQSVIAKNVSLFSTGVGTIIGGIILTLKDSKEIGLKFWLGAGLSGGGLALVVMAFQEKTAYYRENEKKAIDEANKIFTKIPNP